MRPEALHLAVEAVGKDQVVRQLHSEGFHWVARTIVSVTNVLCIVIGYHVGHVDSDHLLMIPQNIKISFRVEPPLNKSRGKLVIKLEKSSIKSFYCY